MTEQDITRETFVTSYAKEAIKNWERYGGFEKVRDLLLRTIFSPFVFSYKFSTEAFILNSAVDRYHLVKFLIEKGKLDQKNLEGKILDIGCHLGATVDALAIYGGEVIGTDRGAFSYASPSGISIARREGRELVRSYLYSSEKPTLVSCFNVDWVEAMSPKGFAIALCNDSLGSLEPNGQVLCTFSEENLAGKLPSFPNSEIVRLPDGLDRREKYAFTLRKS